MAEQQAHASQGVFKPEQPFLLRLALAFGVKTKPGQEKMRKIIYESYKDALDGFLRKDNFNQVVYAFSTGTDQVSLATETPSVDKYKRKSFIILRIGTEELDEENFKNDIIFIEVTKNILEHMHTMCNEVLGPVMQNPNNQQGWTDLVTKDLMERFNNFVAQTYVLIGLSKGRTLLPLPNRKIIHSEGPEKDKAHIFEGSIMTWTKQIKSILKLEPEQALKDGKNPGPKVQLEFWESKANNLNSIYAQLQSVEVKGILRFLERSKSTYTNPFGKLKKQVEDARIEANDNNKFLSTLRELFTQLGDDTREFASLPELFPPIMHTFLKIYQLSKYYNTPPRLVVLIKETCNEVIARANEYINGSMVAAALSSGAEDITEVCRKLQITIDVCSKFKEYYFEYKNKSEGKWKLTLNALFSRLDAYSERCHDILHLTTTIMQFNKLERIELGGTKGKTLTETLKQISEEFKKAVENFRALPYDTMDINQKKFDEDFLVFRGKIKELQRRLASVVTQGFDDNDTIMGKFKLLDCFEGILNRPIIQDELQKKHAVLLDMYKQDLKVVQRIFLEGKQLIDRNDEKSPIYNNYPPVAGALTWCRTLKDRISEPFKKIDSLGKGITQREEYKDVEKLYQNILKIIKDYEELKIGQWEKEVDENTHEKLKHFLISYDQSSENKQNGLLKVNFDPILVKLLRQVKYLKQLERDVPETASKLFEKADIYRRQVVSLELIIQNYNRIVTCLNDVEQPLVKERIIKMNKDIEPGVKQFKWQSPGIDNFISAAKKTVDDLYQIVDKMKKSLDSIYSELTKLKKPMIDRKNKPISPEEYDNILKAAIAQKLLNVKDCGTAVHKLLKQINDAVKFDKKKPEWKKYTEYINTIVTDGICEGIVFALDHLNEQINSDKQDQSQLFEIKLELEGKRGVVYEPEILESEGGLRSVCDTIKGWVNEIFSISHNFPRLDATAAGPSSGASTGDYLVEVKANFIVKYSMSKISNNLNLIVKNTENIKKDLQKYSYLWEQDPEEGFSKFLEQNEPKIEKIEGEEQVKRENILLKGCRELIPNLDLFDEKITNLKQIQIQVSKIQTPVEKAWIKIDLRNFVKSLEVKINSWVKVYTDFLTHEFKTTLKNLKDFNMRTNIGLKTNPKDVFANADPHNERQKEKNRGLLMKVMKHISEMKNVKGQISVVIERMRNMVLKLKKHGIQITEKSEEEPLQAIEASEAGFNETEKKVNEIKKDIINIIADEAIEVKKKLDIFGVKVNEFKTDFKSSLPYAYDENLSIAEILANYGKIDEYYVRLQKFEQQARENAELEDLFELERRNYKPLKECLSDLKNLKTLWDLIALVNLQYNDWKTKFWRQIKADVLIEQNKSFSNQIKGVNKQVRFIKGWQTLGEKVGNMTIVLNLVESLRGDYMEDRHWKQLKDKTRTEFDNKASTFCFDDILRLKLYKLKPEVEEIVDIAQKEFKIDKKLKIIESNWAKQIFIFDTYKENYIFGALDDMMEILDANSLDLMGMKAQGKYVEYFIQTVESWREKLGRVDIVVNEWLKVQKNWRILVNIFVGSEDIRQQLPEDTKVFETVHGEFTEMMAAAHENPLIIETCTEGRKTALIEMSQKIKKCEKALNDYLQQKKKIFPRFYFLSNQSLLTILSNGQNPPKVCEFIGDCFDGLKTLKFKPSNSPTEYSRISDGMYSKDDEEISFSKDFIAQGQVQIWLKNLEFKMRETLYEVLCDAKSTSDVWDDKEKDKPRQEWIKDYCAQIALLTTQIVWTEDVNRAFEELSSGAESAMKECNELIKVRINKLINKVTRPLEILERMKVINIITIDVHSRDVVQNFVNMRINEAESFPWQSQLKFEWSVDKNNDVSTRQFCRFPWQTNNTKFKCIIKIVDWFRFYSYEYVGNTLRLVVTPLTDRCYITLTQALNLVMGGAPAGPAGTGKTETTKDLGRAVGLPVIVFNCSDQMNKDSMAQIFMGLCQSGAWGCFDEFNRISVEVLSVISTQVKTCLDAQKEKKRKFIFLQEGEIGLEDTAGFFITMNPGYAGRAELPDNLKALFRSCAMVVPDLILICENMLMSEGFVMAKDLSKKFVSLYMLSRELLSKQRHYDWGLRAVKSVLRQAGKLKRDPDNEKMQEDPLLMRALRDFNIPKIVTDDKPIFIRLINDLFPNAKPEDKKASKLTKICEKITKSEMGLIPEEPFVKKCIDCSDILEVRHCMFIIGPPGCGKTTVWKTLMQTHKANNEDGQYDTLNPKAVNVDELFGHYTKSKEWRNGVLSVILKNQNKCEEKYKKTHVHKWTILDGDVDTLWIESLNTVMDDNKVLTLVSNDRIPLTPSMRLLFEVSNLKNASPATVSRGGVLFINETDIGWNPFVNSWLDRSQPYMKATEDSLSIQYPPINEVAKAVFFRCFQSYIQTPSEMHDQTKITYLAPPSTMGFIHTICMILDALLAEQDKNVISLYGSKEKEEEQKIIYEAFFIFATMWAYGGSVGGGQDDNEILNKFNGAFRSLVKIKFPEGGLCYDYFWSVEDNKWAMWSGKIPNYEHTDEPIFSKIFVPTIHTTRLRYLLDMHLKRKKPILFVGGAGTGKTQVIKDYLSSTKTDQVAYKTINFSSFTDAASLQRDIESMLDKKSGKTYGSAMNKTLIAFIDDLNMPFVQTYGTQTPIQLLRQIIDYGSIFNREQLQQRKFIQDLLFFSCLNHKSGSFTVDLRLQRNFSAITMYTPTDDIIKRIFGEILRNHLATPGFEEKLKPYADKIMDVTVLFFTRVIKNPQFSPSAKKFHYQFNFRELAKITSGMMRSVPQLFKTPNQVLRLWMHEVKRVFEDRFINNEDMVLFRSILKDSISKTIGDFNEKDTPFAEPIIFTGFMNEFYSSTEDITEMRRVMKEKLDEYNDVKAQMNLVLFDQAIEHVCRISRIIELPSGHALLVGVGGSGKQSLARLASFIIGYQLEQMVVTQSFGMADLRNFLSEMYRKIAKPNSSVRVYMVTDSQIKSDTFLIPINDMLNSGWVSDLFTKQDFDALVNLIRNQAKSNGVPDSIDSLLNYFYDRMKKQLKIILCFSPVGEAMRVRARKFPGIINSTSIDWFHPWPRDALIDVANKFLYETELDSVELREKIAVNMAETHLSIDSANDKFRKFQRRNNYTTPKSFLELISFYKALLDEKRGFVERQIKRYTLGLQILDETKSKVLGLQEELKVKMVEVEKQRGQTNELIEKVQTESAYAEQEQAKANDEEVKTNIKKDEAEKLAETCKVALEKALPALKQAEEAVKCLKKNHIGEMKAFTNPPPGVVVTCRVVLALLKEKLSASDPDDKVWKKAQGLMNQPEKFLDRVLQFNGEEIEQSILDTVNKIVDDPTKKYNEKDMLGQSFAASKLCAWSVNIVIFNKIFKEVKPLQMAEQRANEELRVALEELAKVKEEVRKLNEMVNNLRQKLNAAEQQKKLVEQDAQRCANKLTAAEKLVNGLAGENKRWSENVVFLQANIKSVIGDVLLASEFVSYIGAFSAKLRTELWRDNWLPNIISKEIPMTEGIEPLKILTSEAIKAKWKNEGLPSDNMSFENASIISSCSRWPLLIDPQLQGSNWIRGSQGDNLSPININQKHWMRELTKNITEGRAVLLEGIQEEIEATLDPLLSRAIVKKAGSYSLELGAEVIDYDPKFKLYLMTKLSNPHFRPEIAAQCTIINFIVTQSGLQDQLLAMVVNVEKNELQVKKQELVKKQNEFKVILDELESSLLKQLSEADPATILDNKQLIDNLEKTKATAISIGEQSQVAKATEIDINAQRQIYRPVAAEGAMLYFLCISLCIIDHMYQYSLESFIKFFFKAIEKTPERDETRTTKLIENIRFTIYQWVSRGLFEKHKLIFLSMITFRLMGKKNIEVAYTPEEMDFLVKGIPRPGAENTLDWLPDISWNMVQALSQLEDFKSFAQNMEKDAPTRFKDWYNELTPEDVKLPLEWKKLDSTPFKKLLVLRCLRPDRITVALTRFIRETLPKGDEYIEMDSKSSFLDVLSSVFADSQPQIPIFFILSPGSDPVKEVQKIIKKDRDRYRIEAGKSFFSISLGQGQDEVARRRIEEGNKQGHWIMLQNIHLMPRWLVELEKILDSFSGDTGGSHINFRLLLSAEPSTGVPIGILDRSIKLTNEPPSGIKANMKRAFTYFPKEQVDEKDPKVKCILFGLCFFHSTVIERKRFGPLGWNMSYPFNMGDLRDSYLVLNRYMETASGSSKIPFEDLIYIFGQIMYGGHIVDDWDRRLARGYLENVMNATLFEEEELFPFIDGKNISFKVPLPTNYEKYIEHIETLGAETPLAYGLHPNSEISFRTMQCNLLFSTLLQIAPKDSSAGGEGGGRTTQEILQSMVKRFIEDINIKGMIFSVDEIKNKMDADQKGPYQNVFLQEIEYMTILLTEISRSIDEIDQGMKGLLTISEKMEQTMDALVLNKVPAAWANLAYPTRRGLEGWIVNLLQRCEQLNFFRDDPLNLPKVIMVSRFFNPQSYLTAIKQVVAATANAKGGASSGVQLNKLYIQTDITKKAIEQIDTVPKDGSYVYGFILEGARWDVAGGFVQESRPKEMFSVIPVVYCKALPLPAEGKEDKTVYQCPAYKTEERNATYVFTAQLKTRHPPRKWILAGVAIIMDVEGLSDDTKKKEKKDK